MNQPPLNFWSISVTEMFEKLQTAIDGLTADEGSGNGDKKTKKLFCRRRFLVYRRIRVASLDGAEKELRTESILRFLPPTPLTCVLPSSSTFMTPMLPILFRLHAAKERRARTEFLGGGPSGIKSV